MPKLNSNNTPVICIPEMQERADSIHYMIDTLRDELNLLPGFTGREEIFFRSITKCLNVLEQLSFDNQANLKLINNQLEAEWEANKKAVTP